MKVNTIFPFDQSLLEISIDLSQLNSIALEISSRGQVNGLNKVAWAVKALTLTDLTTLSGDDTKSNVRRLCQRAAYPLPSSVLNKIEPSIHEHIHTAAVCVYPSRVSDGFQMLQQFRKDQTIPIAAVATGFPSGQYSLESRLKEICFAIENGSTEIDIVINRQLALCEQWKDVYEEICAMRKVCGNRAHMKTILAIGELGTMENVYKASIVCMLAGADFIKTSTGKETINATLPVGLVMIYAIKDFLSITNQRVGLKPAGGVRTVDDAITWMKLVKETLGNEWLQPSLFRFGASALLDDIENFVQKSLNE